MEPKTEFCSVDRADIEIASEVKKCIERSSRLAGLLMRTSPCQDSPPDRNARAPARPRN